MIRSYALSLGALAMALVALRGAVRGELAGSVVTESIVALVVFVTVGLGAGWIADYLIRDSLEQMFRARIGWYRKELLETRREQPDSSEDV